MVNLAVIDLKSLIKYFIKILFAILILYILKTTLVYSKREIDEEKKLKLKDDKLFIFLDETIPEIKEINKKEEKEEENASKEEKEENTINNSSSGILKIMIETQISMIENIKEKREKEEKEVSESLTEIEHAETGLETNVVENNVPNTYTNEYHDVKIKNGTSYELDDETLNPNINIENKNILILHTHTCESYTVSEKYNYEQTGTYRTTDSNYNVVRVGTELENQLKSYNYNVIHDNTYHDYPAYNGSYERSLETVKNIINKNDGKIDMVFDIHRDAIADYSYAPKVQIGNEYAAQLMFVIGTDGGGLEHPSWKQNLKFAIKVQEKANELYPGLFKPIVLRNSRYNQHVAKAASIIEVGATGNTMEECLTSMKYLAKVIDEIIK